MNKLFVFPCVLLALAAGTALAQSGAKSETKPLTEADLLKSLDSFSAGDPVKKQPLSIGDSPTGSALSLGGVTLEPKKEEATAKPLPQRGPNETEITAKEATFDQRTHQAVFLHDVVVINPEFRLTSDKLTAYLNQNTTKPANDAAAKPGVTPAATPRPAIRGATPAPAAGAKAGKKPGDRTGGLDRAIAEGNVVITQDKTDVEGNVSQNKGHAKRAVYEAKTGDITLTGRPDVSQGINTCVATDETTVIVLNRDGHMRVFGPHKTIINSAAESSNGR